MVLVDSLVLHKDAERTGERAGLRVRITEVDKLPLNRQITGHQEGRVMKKWP